ncbi:hypothetical protein KAZ57_02205, partial [Patescibacteria group bacterium]|nr:hypothetical protein [Patescibacteria group bacterium]
SFCNTWRARFTAGNLGGLVTFDETSATIEELWEGDLPPIQGMLMDLSLSTKLVGLMVYGFLMYVGIGLLVLVRLRRHQRLTKALANTDK